MKTLILLMMLTVTQMAMALEITSCTDGSRNGHSINGGECLFSEAQAKERAQQARIAEFVRDITNKLSGLTEYLPIAISIIAGLFGVVVLTGNFILIWRRHRKATDRKNYISPTL